MSNASIQMIADAKAFVNQKAGSADYVVSSAQTAITGLVHTIGASFPSFNIAGMTKLPAPTPPGSPPVFDPIPLVLPGPPGAMDKLAAVPAPLLDKAPTFSVTAPVFTPPSQPGALAAFTGSAPSINTSYTFPAPPSALTGVSFAPPDLVAHPEPVAPKIVLPDPVTALPKNKAIQPPDQAGEFMTNYRDQRDGQQSLAQDYVSAQLALMYPGFQDSMTSLDKKLSMYMDTETATPTGFKPVVEEAIYARARTKNHSEAIRVRDQALNDAATRGFTLPSGALMSAMQQARQGGADNNAKAVSEIVVLQAEMEQKNFQFAVTTMSTLRHAAVQAADAWFKGMLAINNSALEAAKEIMHSVIEAYNTAVKVYMADLDAWKAQISLFEAKIKFTQAQVDIYKGELQVLQAQTSVDQMHVEVYKTEISTLTSLAEMYRNQVQAVISQMGQEKLKIELFQSQVQAYSSQVQQKQAEWGGFSASINGYSAQASAFGAQASAYGNQVQAYKGTVDAKSAEIQATAAMNQAVASGYQATVSGFTSSVQALSASNSANISTQQQRSANYRALLDNNTAQYHQDLAYYQGEQARILEQAKEVYGAAMKRSEVSILGLKEQAQLTGTLANVYGGVAAAAASGMNTLGADITNS